MNGWVKGGIDSELPGLKKSKETYAASSPEHDVIGVLQVHRTVNNAHEVCCYGLALWLTGALVAFNATEEMLELEAMYQRIRKTIINVQ